jgi:rare lipoprotein A
MKRQNLLTAALFVGISVFLLTGVEAQEQKSGKATIYSDSFQGKKTANGERYDKHAITAASPSLPLGSKVLVKNRRTGKSIVLKINDRQPAGGHKVVDLSKAAADKLGVKGTGQVDTKVVSKAK